MTKEQTQDDNCVLKEDELLELRGDRLFHDMFNEHEMDTIEWMVSKILDCDIEDIHGNVKVGNIRLTNMSRDDKQKYVDLIVYYDKMITIIELNNNFNGNYLRNTLYVLNALNNSYIVGDVYNKVNKEGKELRKIQGILVNLNWTDKPELEPKYEVIYPYPIMNDENNDFLLKIVNINLDYYKKESYNGKCDKDVLYKLITRTSKKKLKEIVGNEKKLENYYKKMDHLSHDKEYCRMIWDERIEENLKEQEILYRIDKAKKEASEQAHAEGVLQKEKEMILKMYGKNIPIDTIAECSSLTIDEVNNIIKENKN